MRSKSFLAVMWTVATVVAVVIVWQSLGFVSTRTDEATSTPPLSPPTSGAGPATGVTLPGSTPTSTEAGGPAGSDPAGSVPVTTPDTTPATTAVTAPATTAATLDPSIPADAVEQTFELVGGTALVRYSSTGVVVLYASPAEGFQATIEPEDQGMKVEFRSGSHRSRVTVWWAGGPQHQVEERAD